jgi:hypothetical protein
MKSIQKFLLENDDNEVVQVGPYSVPKQIVKQGKGAVEGFISKLKKKRKMNTGMMKEQK